MTQNLEGMGFTVVPFGQGFKDMSPPTKEFYKLLMEGRIIHGGNPVMAWMAGNVVVDTDPAGNIKPTKAKSPEKIDGIVAAIMALDRCIRNEGQQKGSVYTVDWMAVGSAVIVAGVASLGTSLAGLPELEKGDKA